jgi:molybdopterin-guanine dinucleotide biosynthesis protein B
MKAFSFIGRSGSGKTRLIGRLVPELRRRGWGVAVIKHCPHGFSLDSEGKDSRRFFDVGARAVALISPRTPDFCAFAERHFQGVDILLIEGGRARKGIQKIEVLGENERLRPVREPDERVAVVSNQGGSFNKPLFRHSQVKEIARFLESRRVSRTRGASVLNQPKKDSRRSP